MKTQTRRHVKTAKETKVKTAIKYEVKKSRLFKAVTLRVPGTLTHHPFFVIGSLY